MAKLHYWKVWLRPNTLTKEADNDYFAEVSTTGYTLRNEDIARIIVKGRSELRYDTILSILNERDAAERDALSNGSPVQSGNMRLTPRVTGKWTGTDHVYNPAQHRITLDAVQTVEMRRTLEDTGVEVLGKKIDGGAIIGLVTDVMTGKTDGTIIVGGDVIITGDKIKIAPAGESGLGVYFINEYGDEIALDHPASENTPKKIICRLPADITAGGVYTLKIVTRFSNSSTYINDPRIILYDIPLTAVAPL
ncbi:MAG: DUF4469 domain-containing protein [Dysgonamonadaceae bacterium]|jgi:hypothetical protein|nr:DUF4469 domain-containing protein [Dysgonamonadaceae bacterium]